MYAFFNDKKYKIINNVQINKSSREVTYSDLILDFSKCTINDLPYAQQEIQIIEDNQAIFKGFVSDYKLPKLNKVITPKKELTLSLFSPRQMTTKRVVTIMRTAMMSEIVNQILAPLYADGFYLKEINIEDKVITVNLISRTVEEILNWLSNKYSLYWNIDELKGIEINSIDYMLNKEAKRKINIKNYKTQIKGLLNITPEVENIEYANIINVKNARIFYENYSTELNITLKNNDRLEFENPLDISLATAERIAGDVTKQGVSIPITNIQIDYDNEQAYIVSGFNTSGDIKPGLNIKDIARDDSTGAKFILTIDPTFKNLATGIIYKGENPIKVKSISSQTYLRYANMKLINWYEIEQQAGKITPSGQVEKILDVENGWFTIEELIEYVRNTLKNNDKYTNQVIINYDNYNDLFVGDRLEINLPEYFISGNFIITDISETKQGTNFKNYSIKLRNTNLLENFINLFRSSNDIKEQQSQVELEYVVEYTEEEMIEETHKITIDENYNDSLNLILRG